ncbi:hypothetical protein DB354_00415 [Opitutus sp. ER46]|nr:hypothetical protein DB354_00415 [Opitutus sp. ER46]
MERRALLNVAIEGVTSGKNYDLYTHIGASQVHLARHPAESGGSDVSASDEPISMYVGLLVGKKYTFTFERGLGDVADPMDYGTFDLALKLPAGYVAYVDRDGDGIPEGESPHISGSTSGAVGMGGSFTYQIIERSTLNPAPAGELTRFAVGDLLFELGLGTLKNGKSAGRLQLRSDGRVGAGFGLPSAVFTPSGLDYVGPEASGLSSGSWSAITGGKRIETSQARVDVVADGATKYAIKFYATDSAGTYSTTAYAAYTLEKATTGLPASSPVGADCLKITVQHGNLTFQKFVFRDTSADVWTLIEGSGDDERIERHVATRNGATREVAIATKNHAGTVIAKERLTWSTVNSVENLTKQEVWSNVEATAPDLTTTWEYYADNAGKGKAFQIKKIMSPNGFYREFDYYSDALRLGKISKVTEPWSTGTATLSKITTYDYVGETGAFKNYPGSEEVKIGDTTVSKRERTYTFDDYAYTQSTKDYSGASTFTTTTTKAFYPYDNFWLASRPLSITAPSGLRQCFAYESGSYANGTFTVGSGYAYRTWVLIGASTGGTAVTTANGITFESIVLVANQSTLNETIRDSDDNIVREKTYVWDGVNWDLTHPIVDTTREWQDSARLASISYVTGAAASWTWNGRYLTSDTDETGIERTYTYDSVGRPDTVTTSALDALDGYQSFAASVVTYDYTASNQKASETQSSGNDLSRTTTYTYDGAGRPDTTVLPDGRSRKSLYSFPEAGVSRTAETLPCGGVVITDTLVDGKTLCVYDGTGVDRYYSYAVETTGISEVVHLATADSARWEKTTTDWLGRTIEQRKPGFTGQADIVEVSVFNESTGLLDKVTRTGFSPRMFEYDSIGQLKSEGIDLGANGTLLSSDVKDRITDHGRGFAKIGNSWWEVSEQWTYPSVTSATSRVFVKGTSRRLTGWSGGLMSEVVEKDAYGNATNTSVVVESGKRRRTTTVSVPGASSASVEVQCNGLVVKRSSADGRVETLTYDGLGRLTAQVDSRTAATTKSFTYLANGENATDLVQTVTETDKKSETESTARLVATYTYDKGGRVESVKDANGMFAYYGYDCAGRQTRQWGAAVLPVERIYNSYGELSLLTTFRAGTGWTAVKWPENPTGNSTIYRYDGPSGLLTQQEDDDGRKIDYTYNERGLVEGRKWARLNTTAARVTTTYEYHPGTAERSNITYNDGTPSVSYTYNRLGQLETATDIYTGSATQTRTLVYGTHLELETEKLPAYFGTRWMTYTYEDGTAGTVTGRANGYKLGIEGNLGRDMLSKWTYSEVTGNPSKLTAAQMGVTQREFEYEFVPNSSLVSGVKQTTLGYAQSRSYEANRDVISAVDAKFGTVVKAKYEYTYDALFRRETAKQSGSVFSSYANDTFYVYGYNNRSELTTATGYLGSDVTTLTAPMPGRYYDFDYDHAGNRTSANSSGSSTFAATYTPNDLNQTESRQNHYAPVNGTVDQAAKVLVDGILAGRQQTYWAGEAFLDNANGPAYDANVQIKAVKPGATDTKQTTTVAAFLPPATETLTYDEDGNLKSDGRWAYAWDAENRLVEMKTTDAAAAAGLPARRLEFRYDSLGRRIGKVVSTKSGTTWTAIQDLRFVYQGWNLIAEVNASDALQRTYVWGLDLASSLNATGGIGALVQMVDHTGTATAYLPAYDGGGNVAALMSSDGSPAAVYEYGPFGERMRAEGTYATTNPFRHATKFTDEESGLVYYGRRYYSPSLGRFISRDPIGAAGGPNLYGFVANDPVNRSDYLGMAQDDPPSDPGPNVYRRPPYDELGNTDYGVYGPGEPPPLGPSAPVAPNKGDPNKKLSQKDCDTLAAKIANNQKTLAGMVDTVSRESIADRIMGAVMEGLDQSMPYSDMAENFAEGGYRLGKAGLDAVGARGARKALTSVYSGGGAKVINAVGVVNNVWDAAQVGRAIYNRDGLGFIQSSAGLASDFVTAVPAFKMAISGFKFVWDGESQRAQNDIEMADLTSIAANGQAANLNAIIGLKNVAQWKKEFVDGGCK